MEKQKEHHIHSLTVKSITALKLICSISYGLEFLSLKCGGGTVVRNYSNHTRDTVRKKKLKT
jgi:hypothetical protein